MGIAFTGVKSLEQIWFGISSHTHSDVFSVSYHKIK